MLKELSVNNFLSYEKERMEFPTNATIAVVGKNGHGKSSMLEAIPFALFGAGRTNLAGMVRIGSTGGMKVSLKLADVPKPGSEMVVERGVLPSGGGYTKVWVDDTLMAKGGASAGNNKAQDFIDMALGTNESTFFLTSFFGMGANDRLMQVGPAERLETMQVLANVDICQSFHNKAKDMVKVQDDIITKQNTSIETLENVLEDPKVLEVNLENARSDVTRLTEERETLYTERNGLLSEEDRFRKLVSQKEIISNDKSNLTRQVEAKEKHLVELKGEYRILQSDADRLVAEKEELVSHISKLSSPEAYQGILDELKGRRAVLMNMIKLKSEALTSSGDGNCPVCDTPLAEHSQDKWTKDIIRMRKELADIEINNTLVNSELNAYKSYEKKLDAIKNDMAYGVTEGTKIKETGISMKKDVDGLKADMEKVDTKYIQITKELSGFEDTMRRIRELDKLLEKTHTDLGAAEQKVINAKDKLDKNKAQVKSIAGFKKTKAEAELDAQAASLVKEAFSRYAIPVQLLRSMRESIEKRASRIYREFGNGRIRITDTEGARPGIEFVLEDESGQREYKVLSMGEKVMMFISIRVALTDIVNKQKDHRIQFLILDEVTGNLDPDMRESLTRLINKLLRTYFPQVFMVSHVALRDIFTKTFDVTKINGVSRVS